MLLGLVRSSQAAVEGLQATLVGYGERLAACECRQPQASQPAALLGGAGAHHLPACFSAGLRTLTALDMGWLLLHGCRPCVAWMLTCCLLVLLLPSCTHHEACPAPQSCIC